MKSALFCLVLGVMPASGQVPDDTAPTVAVYVGFQHEPSQLVVDSIETEVGVILAPMGARLEWRSLDVIRPGESAQDLAVANFKGTCNPDRPAPLMPPGSLGKTHVSDGVVLPFCEVDCDRIRSFLSAALARLEARERSRDFGRAVGRVLGHELYHIFSRTRDHEIIGLGKAALSVKDLMAARFQFTEGALPRFGDPPVGSHLSSDALKAVYFRAGCALCHGDAREGSARGPGLPVRAGAPQTRGSLAARLGNSQSLMALRANSLNLHWPRLDASELDALAAWLNEPR